MKNTREKEKKYMEEVTVTLKEERFLKKLMRSKIGKIMPEGWVFKYWTGWCSFHREHTESK